MEAESIVLPQKLGKMLREKAEEMGYLPEDLGIEFMLKGLNKNIDPEDLVEHYRVLSEKYLTEARELLKKGDLVQASETFWDASALAVKSIGAKKRFKVGRTWWFVVFRECTGNAEW